jgi:hypothetical protein
VIVFVLVSATWSAVGTSSPAQAAPAYSTLLAGGFSSMAIDPSNDLIFVSLPTTGIVEVVDFSGNVVDTIHGFGTSQNDEANSIIYADDFIYMTDTANGTIDRIDPSTMTVSALTTGLIDPLNLAYSAGSLWSTTGGYWPPPTLVGINMSTGTATSYGVSLEGAGLVSGPGLADTLFSYNMGDDPLVINRIDVTSTPTVSVSEDEDSLGGTAEIGSVGDIALSPEGSHLVPAGGAPYQFSELNTSDLLPSGTVYPASPYPTAVAMTSANGGLFAGGIEGEYNRSLVVYPLDNPSDLLMSYEFLPTGGSEANDETAPRGVSFSPDGDLLFVVSEPFDSSAGATFHVFDMPTTTTTTTTSTTTPSTTSPTTTTTTSTTTPTTTPTTTTTTTSTTTPTTTPTITTRPTTSPPSPTIPTGTKPPPSIADSSGYDLVGSDGGVFTFGSAPFYGSTGSLHLQRPVVGITPTADHGGYWLVASDGGIFTFGDAAFFGSIPGLGFAPAGSPSPKRLNAPIVGVVPSADGGGYFMVASDGGVFTFGDAKFEGSCPSIGGCSGAAVAVMPDADGNGYWLVTATGHVYAFGNATTYGAPGPHNVPVTSATRTDDGGGYWILFADGDVEAYGDAPKLGGPDGLVSSQNPATAIVTTSDGEGYWVVTTAGSVFTYGDAPYEGGASRMRLNGPIIAATGW